MNNEIGADDIPTQGRGPAYPFIPLRKAIERIEQVRDANMARVAVSPLAFYKSWGFQSENGNARQTMAALNHFGLVEYHGRGRERQVKLSSLAQRIVFDKIPDSKERAAAIKEAAITPSAYQKLWEQYGREIPPDYVLETFLVRDQSFNDAGAKNVIGGYRDTFEFARLDEPDNMPDNLEEIQEARPMLQEHQPRFAVGSGSPVVLQSVGMPTAITKNDIKVLLDGGHLRVSAYVDAKGAKKLIKVLQANLALIEDEDED